MEDEILEEELDEETKLERIIAFKDVAGDELDQETCEAILLSANWSVESAIRNFFEAPTSPRIINNNNMNTPYVQEVVEEHVFSQREDPEDDENNERTGFFDGVRARRGRGISPENDIFNNGFGVGGRIARAALPPPIAPPVSFTQLLKEAFVGQVQESASSSARKFAAEFDRIVGRDRPVPDFFESSFEDALLDAATEKKLLVVYVHSPVHPHTEMFCRDILCSAPLLNALNDVRIWGGSVQNVDGYLAASKVQAAGFPCLVVIVTDRGNEPKVVERIYTDEIMDPNFADKVAIRIITCKTVRETFHATATANAREVDERRRVVQEQDAALQSAIEQDKKKQEEKRLRELEEAKEKQRLIEEEERKTKELEIKRSRIQPEPDAKTPEIATIRFQFPEGTKFSRRFLGSDTIGYVRDILDVHLVDTLKNSKLRYALVSNFPKQTFNDNEVSLKAAGLVPQAVLLLQDLDA